MKVYVDELPKDCWNCEFLDKDNREYEGCYCAMCQREFNDEDIYVSELSFEHKKNEDCPLQSLADYTKQVRKKVCEEIKDKLKLKEKFHPEDEFTIDYDFYYKEDVEEVLDQLQGEDK